ncbi:hypothetical protein B0T25DRAFT_145405 [Lasiosphaeria hispida]|uniref:PDZ domain-containing protein n=1 Tax=Lasiosphaeria hispida TaxID=260671 RepID=A0AAJ0HLD7_9PEZI|nr:hypothetical protein B0T25DRAFT_145405 [Lasiosphaeria hispida]
MWGNRTQGDGWCIMWTPRSRDLVKTGVKSKSSERLLLNIVDMDLARGPVVWGKRYWQKCYYGHNRGCYHLSGGYRNISQPNITGAPRGFRYRFCIRCWSSDGMEETRALRCWHISANQSCEGKSCGLQNGDIVVAADDKPVPTSLSFASSTISLTAIRDGKVETVTVDTIPQSNFERVWSVSWSGLILQPVPFERSILMKEVPRGLHVSGVQPGSPAASWGIIIPSYLLRINRVEVLDKERLLQLVRGLDGDANVDLTFQYPDGQMSHEAYKLSRWFLPSITEYGRRVESLSSETSSEDNRSLVEKCLSVRGYPRHCWAFCFQKRSLVASERATFKHPPDCSPARLPRGSDWH